jgi:Rho GTPase-activating protein 19
LLVGLLPFPGLVQEGLFRRNGKVKQQQELMNLVKEKQVSEIKALLESNAYSVHEVATVLKNLLSEMPEPLLIESYYPLHCCLASMVFILFISLTKLLTVSYFFRVES